MNIKFFKFISILCLFFISFSSVSSYGFHEAYEVWNGTFNTGKYTFPDNLEVGGEFRSSEICLNGDCKIAWPVSSGDITAVNVGTGIIGGGLSGDITLSLNFTYLDNLFVADSDLNLSSYQQRVSSTCSAGSSIRVINADGSVVCEIDTDTNTNTQLSEGEVDAFVANNGYSIGAHTVDTTIPNTNAQTICAAGEYLDGDGSCNVLPTGAHTVDTNTQLSEAEVDAFVANNGYSIGGDADTLDGLDSTDFLRSDISGTLNGELTIIGQDTVNTIDMSTSQGYQGNFIATDGGMVGIQDSSNNWVLRSSKDIYTRLDVAGVTRIEATIAGANIFGDFNVYSPAPNWHAKLRLKADAAATGGYNRPFIDILGADGTGVMLKLEGDSGNRFDIGSSTGTNDIGTHFLSILSDGKVGIGTTNPLRALHVVGADGPVSSFPTIGGKDEFIIENNHFANLALVAGTNMGSGIKFYEDGASSYSGQIAYNHDSNYFSFTTDGFNSSLYISKEGNIGVRNVLPNVRLDVAGDIEMNNELVATENWVTSQGYSTGAGGDAETLDGIDSTGFFGKDVAGSIDVDSVLPTNFYIGSTSGWTNKGPLGSNAGALLNLNTHSGNYFSQLWFDTSGDEFYIRHTSSAVPSGAWDKIRTSKNDNEIGILASDNAWTQKNTFTGLVGIGNTNPLYTLDVSDNGDVTALAARLARFNLNLNANDGNTVSYASSISAEISFATKSGSPITESDNGFTVISASPKLTGDGTVNTFAAVQARGAYYGGNSTNHILFRAVLPSDLSSGNSHIQNLYGLKIGPLSSAGFVTNSYGIYQQGASDMNYFAGKVGIGVNGASVMLDVAGDIEMNNELVATETWVNAQGFGGADADTLDGIDSTGFWKNTGTWRGSHTDKTRIVGISDGGGEVWFGFDGGLGNVIVDGQFYAGESNSLVWNQGNDGGGSGLDADLLDGFNLDSANVPSTVAKRDGNGDISARLFRSEYATTNSDIGYIMTQIDLGSNNYLRPTLPSQFRTSVTDAYYLGISAKANDANTIDGYDSSRMLIQKADIEGSVDLDSIVITGLYHQNTNANAGYGTNYPYSSAGMLEVIEDGNMVYQKYTAYGSPNNVYIRVKYNTIWTPWRLQYNSGTELDGDLIADGTIDSSEIEDNTLTSDDLAADSVGDSELIDYPTFNRVVTTSSNDYCKYGVWSSSSTYCIGMYSARTYGGLNDYAMTFTMSNIAERGFLWRDDGDSASDGAMSLTTIGDLTVKTSVTSGAYYYISDERLKKNIKKLDSKSALDKIMKLDGVSFDWISQEVDSGTEIGLIAQNVEEVFPELVRTNSDGFKSVEYGNLVAPLIEAVKEQQAQIDELRKEIEMLKNE